MFEFGGMVCVGWESILKPPPLAEGVTVQNEGLTALFSFCIGQSRAGTTYLYHNFLNHPGILVPTRKESNYLGINYDKGLPWLLNQYTPYRNDESVLMDISGMYFMEPEIIDRINEFNSDAKVILGFREPVSWISSLYRQYERSFEIPPLWEFISGFELEREGEVVPINLSPGSIKSRIDDFSEAFGSRLLIFDFAILKDDPLGLMRAIESHLGVSSWFNQENIVRKRVNAWDRKGNLAIERTLNKRNIANSIVKLLPRNLLLRIRRRLEIKKAPTSTESHKDAQTTFDSSEIGEIEERYQEDIEYYHSMFRHGKIVFGNSGVLHE